MTPRRPALLLLLLVGACPAAPSATDAGAGEDRSAAPSEAGLARCERPGQPCRPADPCGLNPRCGEDRLCRTQGRRFCDDGIGCTEDRCVPGGCDHEVAPGSCLIDGACHTSGEARSCGRCEPEANALAWTPVSGTPCDDQNLCTKGDTCRQGVCMGQFYSCNDGLSCTDDACDGTGACHHYLKPGHCLIEKACYQAAQTDASGCLACAPELAQQAWTPRTNVCTIQGKCHAAASKDPTGCYLCDPVHSPTAWTQLPDLCDIGGSCLQPGTLHESKCAVCAPSEDPKFWSPLAGATLTWAPFTEGLSGFVPTLVVKGVGWQVATARYRSPPTSLYYGDLAKRSYNNGQASSGVVSSPPIKLPPAQKTYLAFELFLDVEPTDNYDVLSVSVQGQEIWTKSSATVSPTDYKKWIPILVELSAFAGQTVTVQLGFKTADDQKNDTEGVYIDDFLVLAGCGAL